MSTKIVAARLATAAGVTTVITRSSKPGNITEIVAYAEALKHAASQHTEGDAPSATPAPELPVPPLHTRFLPSATPIPDRRFWLLHGLAPHGTIYIDQGAAHALTSHAGLLPVGIVDVDGSFAQQECVRLVAVTARRKTISQSQSEATNTGAPASPSAIPPRVAGALTRSASTTTLPSSLANDAANREVGRALVNYSATEIRRIAGLRSSEIVGVLGYADSEYVAFRENVALLSVLPSRPATPTASGSSGVNSQRGGGVGTFFDGADDRSVLLAGEDRPDKAGGGLL